MIKRIKNVFVAAVATIASLFILVPAAVSAADAPNINNSLCQGANLQVGSTCDAATSAKDGENAVNKIITLVINIFSIAVGVVSVIMIIIGGFKYITSGGDSGNVTGAKNTILYAIIGLVVVALAQLIVKFVLGKASGI
jgi:hypothetical protein